MTSRTRRQERLTIATARPGDDLSYSERIEARRPITAAREALRVQIANEINGQRIPPVGLPVLFVSRKGSGYIATVRRVVKATAKTATFHRFDSFNKSGLAVIDRVFHPVDVLTEEEADTFSTVETRDAAAIKSLHDAASALTREARDLKERGRADALAAVL
jgi:hypothetical protein